MNRITADGLWSTINHLAEQHPDRAEGLVDTIFAELGYKERRRRRYRRAVYARRSRSAFLKALVPLIGITRRFEPHAYLLLGYVAGYEAAGATWSGLAQGGAPGFELAVVEYDHAMAEGPWRRAPR